MVRIHRSAVLVAILLVAATTPVAGASPDATFESERVVVTAGETANVTVELSDTDTATVTVGSEEVNYIATVLARDGNGDGTVTVRYNTTAAGHGGAFAAAGDADNVTVESESEFDADHLLAAGAYDLSVAPGTNASNATDAGTLVVEAPPETSTEPVTETSTPSPYVGHVDDIENGVVVAPARNQTITGTLNVSEGTEIVVTAKKSGEFLKTQATTVGKDGQFRASFDFDDVSTEDPEFTVEIRANDEEVAEINGVLQTPPTTSTTTEQALQDGTTGETTDAPQSGDIPGFGLSTGVLALAASGLLLFRRR
ncbi:MULTISPECIES: BGTF surface domain-containing protein [Halorussus]|uniref:DUF7827 domain-containing protein n=1 Tax=Halorussus TaxID=1070314 RepID=UPI00209F0576|nr:BGTF surface domain-containing protein [Halorussus vallis]USZ75897.1 hypothetical protein NGM07_00915 [Halorussus vallis]